MLFLSPRLVIELLFDCIERLHVSSYPPWFAYPLLKKSLLENDSSEDYEDDEESFDGHPNVIGCCLLICDLLC